jgi:hypothetical protein
MMRHFIIDGFLVVVLLVLSSLVGALLADYLEGKISHRIALELQEITR